MIGCFAAVLVAVVAADLITKYTVDGIVNPGIAWGIGADWPWLWMVIVVVSFVLAAVLIGYVVYRLLHTHQRPWLWTVGMALFVGGILGNAIDRIITGGVVHDFIDFVIFKNNVADIAITLGAVLICGSIIIGARHAA
ncbi:MAG: signal peptidase II [Prevotella sp.]|nr:signal peptidase II [Prevotella sp.]